MIGYWTLQYFKNNDLAVVDFESFKDAGQIYPDFSMCFWYPLLEKKLKQIHPKLNTALYLAYLKGELDHKIFRSVDYHNVTLHVKDYVDAFVIHWRNGSRTFQKEGSGETFVKIYLSVSYTHLTLTTIYSV